MKVAIVGAGAMGTLIGHGLCRTTHEVAMVDTPARVAQIIAAGGLVVRSPDGDSSQATPALVTSSYAEVGVVDAVILATKGHILKGIAAEIGQITRADTMIVPIQNGIPWWYLYNAAEVPRELVNTPIACLDPDGVLESALDITQIIGCVAYPAASLEADGVVQHVEGVRFPVGELDGSNTDRVQQLADVFVDGGFKSRVIDDIRAELWLKCWGALSINPVSALTRATMVDICTFDQTRMLIQQMMEEAKQVAERLGVTFRHTVEKRIDGASAVGAHKTSTLQDVENGRPLELDAVMLSVLELGQRLGVATPTIHTIYACMALINENLLRAAGD